MKNSKKFSKKSEKFRKVKRRFFDKKKKQERKKRNRPIRIYIYNLIYSCIRIYFILYHILIIFLYRVITSYSILLCLKNSNFN